MSDLDYYLRIKRNQVKMVKNRGYDITEDEWILDETLSSSKFKKNLLKRYDKSYPIHRLLFSEYEKNNDKSLFVFFVGLEKNSKQIKKESLEPFIKKLTQEKVKKIGLLIINADLSPSAADTLNKITECSFQVINESLLKFDLLSHFHVPEHLVLEEQEAEEFKKKNGLTNKSLSVIFQTDPVAMYYHFVAGQMIKVKTRVDIDFMNTKNVSYCIIVNK